MLIAGLREPAQIMDAIRTMSNPSQHTHHSGPDDVSRQALSIARTVDRVCRAPGLYAIVVDIPPHQRNPWRVQVVSVDLLRELMTPRRR